MIFIDYILLTSNSYFFFVVVFDYRILLVRLKPVFIKYCYTRQKIKYMTLRDKESLQNAENYYHIC